MGSMVQHNIVAMNANRNLNVTTSSQAKSTEKLSTGYKINRAADDAAGLSISEKMRRQIRGLTQASNNAQDGISSVQTAEGALTEVHDMLQRMDQLATKASNGTMSESDRGNVQDEIDALLTEIDRVSETTKFNEIYLLKGNTDGTTSTQKVNAHDAGLAGKITDEGDKATFKLTKALEDGDTVCIAGKNYNIGNGKLNAATCKTSANMKTLLMKTGESATDGDKTFTWTDDVSVNGALQISYNAKDRFLDADGNNWYATSKGSGSQIKISDGNGTVKALKDVIGEGWTVASSKTLSKAGKTLAYNVGVRELNDGEVSTVYGNGNFLSATKMTASSLVSLGTGSAATFTERDKVVAYGKTYTCTDETAIDYKDVEHAITSATFGTQFELTTTDDQGVSTTVSYAIAEKNDFSGTEKKVTRDYLLAQINEFDEITYGGSNYTIVGKDADANSITVQDAYKLMTEELKKASSIGTDKEASVKNNGNGTFEITKGSVDIKDALDVSLHVGSDADMTNKISVKLNTMDTAGLGIKNLNVKDDTGAAATYAIDSIEDAIKVVSNQRSALGAVQNRLEHTIKNLDNVVENTTSAESQIRDTDMATEMVTYSKNNILAQAGQSMLAQANQSNQGVLSLLG